MDSLKKLNMPYVDLLLLHQCYNDVYGSWRALERIYKETETEAESEVKPDFEIKPEIKEEKQMPSYTEEKKADFSETPSRNKIICPVCGKEQIKNAFGCIYCHNKWE